MSRLLVTALLAALFLSSLTNAQPLSDAEVAMQFEKARQLVAVDAEGCVKYPKNDEIVVCGSNPDNKSQRIFQDRGDPDDNRLRRGEAISGRRAVECQSGVSMCKRYMKGVGIGFGYVPPVAIPLEEVLKGLPEPDMIVTDGEQSPP